MAKTILYIAQSIDGYIARPDGNLEWLTSMPMPTEGDYGYAELIQNTETIVMGRATYEELLGFGEDWYYPTYTTYVVTQQPNYNPTTENTFAVSMETLASQWSEIKEKSKKNIWLVGGGLLVSAFLEKGWIDEMILSIAPIMLGEGIRLFPKSTPESRWQLVETKPFETGFVNVRYKCSKLV